MQRRIVYILLLMSFSVLLLIGLQFYWNYSNYLITINNFKKESKNALVNAVATQKQLRRNEIADEIKRLMADTSFLTITCNTNNRDSSTVFEIKDTHPKFKEDTARKLSYKAGMVNFNQKLKKITPKAKQHFINHFIENTLSKHLKEGIIYFYTQGLGDSITAAMYQNKFNVAQLTKLYQAELKSKGIINAAAGIAFAGEKTNTSFYHTANVNVSLVDYGKQDIVYGIIQNPNRYYLKEMKCILLSSALLIAIVVICFYYTAKTLLNQQKLSLLKNQFVNNMTHEIHTPLTSIKITTEALQKFDLDENARSEYLAIIQHQTNKLIHLTDQLLNKARSENFDINDLKNINLNNLIQTTIKAKAYEKLVKINYTGTNLYVKGSEMYLSNVFVNLIDNAIKYNNAKQKQITIVYSNDKKFAKIAVSDNGNGIDKTHLKQVFDPFYRVPNHDIHNVKGYGLGLSYVKTVIEKHGGYIDLQSEINKGSTFNVYLPHA